MEKFDAIVIGAGPAGSMAALLLAQGGLNVLLVERGQAPGSKNSSGGLIYYNSVAHILPQLAENAPVERSITSHQLVMLSGQSSVAADFRNYGTEAPPTNAFSVLRARFDPWLANMAEEAGASLITGVTVDSLLVEDGRVVGIQAGPDKLSADVVVVAEGTRSLLLDAAGLREDYHPHDISLGVKEVIALPEEVINERFQCAKGTGAAYTLVGNTLGIEGGGFLYTNRSSLSLGVVVKIDSLYQSKTQPHQVLDAFKSHPLIGRLTEGGEVVEYSAQTVHRGGFHLKSKLYGNGYVVVGSAARLLVNNVLTLRGMDFAIVSAAIAARSILAAREKGAFTSETLASYEANLSQSPIYQDWRTFGATYSFLENKRLFELYPAMVCNMMEKLFSPTDQASSKILPMLRTELRGKASLIDVSKDAYQLLRGFVL